MKSSLIMIMMVLILVPSVFSTLESVSCFGDGQAFFMPEIVEERTISIPCIVEGDEPINVSCVAVIYFEDEIISTYPPIEDVKLFGRSNLVRHSTDQDSSSFVVKFANRDLLHLGNFSYRVTCGDDEGNLNYTEGTILTEYPFSEPVVDTTRTFFQRDFAVFLFAMVIVGLVVLIGRFLWRLANGR